VHSEEKPLFPRSFGEVPTVGLEVHLARRPVGWPEPDDFQIVEAPISAPPAGRAVVRNQFLAVEPHMRVRMSDVSSYAPPYDVGAVMDGPAVGVVIASAADGLPAGATVLHQQGWREYSVLAHGQGIVVDPSLLPSPSGYLSVLGAPGLTAYVGLTEIGSLLPGDTVYVSAAAGGVGGLAGQMARLLGAGRVVGSVGTNEKVRYVTRELGFDAAFCYREESVADGLARVAPDGIDLYFDNVGDDHLEAAIDHMRVSGRIAVCGAIAQYNAADWLPGPRNLTQLITKRLTMRGFLVRDHMVRLPDFAGVMLGWLADGSVRLSETVVHGIERAPETFIALMHGDYLGKPVVSLQPPAEVTTAH
jgi:NADPH-dependent curcumin reductase CurA